MKTKKVFVIVSLLVVISMVLTACAPQATEAPKQEAPKQEAPKEEAPKQEAPKQEAPKEEAPKQEAPTVEAPKKEEAPAAKLPLAGKKIGFINAGPDDYYAQFGNSMKAIGGLIGAEVFEVNSDYKPEKELANVQDLIAKGVDAIAVITAGAAGSAASIKAANDAKVPIFFIAGKPVIPEGGSIQGWVSDNFVIMGYMIGKYVVEKYPEAKGKVVDIPGFLGQGPAEGEIVGFDMAFEEAGWEKAFLTKSSEWQRQNAVPITQDLLTSGRDVKVIFACNEETAFGVVQAMEEAGKVPGKDIIIVSNNGKEEGWQLMLDGKMAATVPNPPSLNADLSLQQMIRYFNKEKYDVFLEIKPPFVLTKDNVDKAIPYNAQTYLVGRAAGKFEYKLEFYEAEYAKNKDMIDGFNKKLVEYMAK